MFDPYINIIIFSSCYKLQIMIALLPPFLACDSIIHWIITSLRCDNQHSLNGPIVLDEGGRGRDSLIPFCRLIAPNDDFVHDSGRMYRKERPFVYF